MKEMLTVKEVEKIHSDVKDQIKVSCDEYHQHGLNCLTGPTTVLTIVKLCETIKAYRRRMRKIQKELHNYLGSED